MKNKMVIKYDPDCMTKVQGTKMESSLLRMLKDNGWGFLGRRTDEGTVIEFERKEEN